jgi:hypothetical protein
MDKEWEDRPPSKFTVNFMTELKSSMLVLQNNQENISKSLAEMKEDNATAHIRLTAEIKEMNAQNKCDFVNKEEFKPIRAVVYGMAGTILTLFLLGLASLVIIKLK